MSSYLGLTTDKGVMKTDWTCYSLTDTLNKRQYIGRLGVSNMSNQRKTFTKEFKLEAIRLMSESDKPSAEIAAELGIRRNMLYKK